MLAEIARCWQGLHNHDALFRWVTKSHESQMSQTTKSHESQNLMSHNHDALFRWVTPTSFSQTTCVLSEDIFSLVFILMSSNFWSTAESLLYTQFRVMRSSGKANYAVYAPHSSCDPFDVNFITLHLKQLICRVGQNHIYTVYIRCFWQKNHQIYGHIRCIYTVLANPTHLRSDPQNTTGRTVS
jgi:succinate dehydrogenase flavin-adding protein (antitoxin of CptAB toxin-antitoxin module)